MRAALFLAAAILSAATIWFGIGPHDEGLMLQAARRIADGQWPYRDFWWNYGPGQPLLLSPFGGSLVAWRVIRVLLDATVSVLAYDLARRLAGGDDPRRGRLLGLLAGGAVAAAMAWPAGPGPNPAALALGLGALLAAPRHVRAAGALAGIAAVFRIEIGVAAALGVAALGAPRALPWAAGTALAGWLPFLVVAPGELVDQTLGFLAIQDRQRLPFPLDPSAVGLDPNKLLELWMPAILVAGTVLWALAAVRHRPPGALALAPLVLVGLAYLLGRTDEFHLVPLAAVLPVALVAAARGRLAIALVAVVALIAAHGVERKLALLGAAPDLGRLPGTPVRADVDEAHDRRAVVRAIGDRSIFVVPPRTDRLTVGDPLTYVLAGKPNPTRYDVMQPGVVTTAAVQREIVADLQRARPEVLVRWLDPRTAPEDNASGRERGARILDAHLRATYDGARRRIGAYELVARGR